jgi:hypothetical protein
MELYFDQIPEEEGFSVEDYPEDTIFILDDAPLQRDPETHQLIPPEKRPKVYPPSK